MPTHHSSRFDFHEIAVAVGVEFDHHNGASGRYFSVETYGSGLAFFDCDRDGDSDLYIVNSGPLVSGAPGASNRLFRNDGGGHFTAGEEASAEADTGYGLGVAVGDYDNDGLDDIYVTNYGSNALYRNQGGWFENVTEASATGDRGWGTSAAFSDVDLDGDLDLYVANYARLDLVDFVPCDQNGVPVYCGPLQLQGAPAAFFRNRGDGTFVDETVQWGLNSDRGRQLGVVFGDYDLDGDPDIYIANDATANFLYRNELIRFEEIGLFSATAFNPEGDPEAGMGVDAGDYDLDGDLDIVITNYQWESNRLYRNDGRLVFSDVTAVAGLQAKTLPYLGFGVNLADFDNDRSLDMYIANGHVDPQVQDYDRGASYAQHALLFANTAEGAFIDHSAVGGPGLKQHMVARGTATADYDDDGDLDICTLANGDRAYLYRNDSTVGSWLQCQLRGTQSNRSGIGARLMLWSGGKVQYAEVRSGTSYLSQSDLRVHFGLGKAHQADSLLIYWPSGVRQVLTAVTANQNLEIIEPDRP